MPRIYGEVGKHFNNKIATLEKMIDQELRNALVEIGEYTVGKIQKYIDEKWYNTYSPSEYDRTGSLKNAVRYTIVNGKSIRIFFDKRYFATRIVNGGAGWQPHRGFDGELFIEGLIDFLNDGGGGGSTKNPRRNDGGIDITGYAEKIANEYAQNLIDKKIKIIIKKYL